jgi:uridine monophosphate synthetase
MSLNSDLIGKLLEKEIVKNGSFKLKSGKMSNIYINFRDIYSYPNLVNELCEEIVKTQYIEADHILGVPYAGIPFATVLSQKTGVPLLMLRKERKNYGTKQMIEGKFSKNDTVFIIDDVITTGESLTETIKNVEDAGLIVKKIVVLADREEGGVEMIKNRGYMINSLFCLTDFIMNPYSQKIMQIKSDKKSSLIFSVDLPTMAECFNMIQSAGEHVCAIKTHVDAIKDFEVNIWKERINQLKAQYNFMVIEDRKMADIGNTCLKQIKDSPFCIEEWADMITCYAISGEGIFDALKETNLGLIVIAQLSSKNNLIDETYTERTVELAKKYRDQVVGFVSQEKIPGQTFLTFTPGINFSIKNDEFGQVYCDQDSFIKKGADFYIVGRGIYNADNPRKTAEEYQNQLMNV